MSLIFKWKYHWVTDTLNINDGCNFLIWKITQKCLKLHSFWSPTGGNSSYKRRCENGFLWSVTFLTLCMSSSTTSRLMSVIFRFKDPYLTSSSQYIHYHPQYRSKLSQTHLSNSLNHCTRLICSFLVLSILVTPSETLPPVFLLMPQSPNNQSQQVSLSLCKLSLSIFHSPFTAILLSQLTHGTHLHPLHAASTSSPVLCTSRCFEWLILRLGS